MRHLLFLFTFSLAAQTTPTDGIFHDGHGALRRLQGTEGAWVAPILVPSGVLSAGYNGQTLWYKTETELHVIGGAEVVVPAPPGPAAAKFNESGDLDEIYFAGGQHALWRGGGLQFLDPVEEVPHFEEDLGPGRVLLRRGGALYAWTPGSAPVPFPLAETPSFQLVNRDGETNVPVGSSFAMPPAAVGDSTTARFRILNLAANSITINRLSIDPSPFQVFDQFYPPKLIAAGGFADFSVRFSPTAAGDFSSTLWVNDLQVQLQGSTTAATTVEILEGSIWKPLASPCDLGTVERRQTLTRRLRITPPSAPTVAGTGFSLAADGPEWLLSAYSDTPGTRSGTLQVAGRTFAVSTTFTEFPLPDPEIVPESSTFASGQQQKITLQLSNPAQATLLGILKLRFESTTTDDAAIAFLPRMERQVNFRFNEGSTTADFSGSDSVLLQTGSTAGTLVLTVDLGTKTVESRYRIDLAPVAFTTIKASISSSLAEILLTGLDNTRSAGRIAFTFYRTDGQAASPGRLDADVSSSFQSYFSTAATGTFQLRATFPVSGDSTALAGVDVEITNSQGVTKTARLSLNSLH